MGIIHPTKRYLWVTYQMTTNLGTTVETCAIDCKLESFLPSEEEIDNLAQEIKSMRAGKAQAHIDILNWKYLSKTKD